MDQANEDEDPNSWTPDRLRNHQSLTLSSDVTLLKCMQSISTVCKFATSHLTFLLTSCHLSEDCCQYKQLAERSGCTARGYNFSLC